MIAHVAEQLNISEWLAENLVYTAVTLVLVPANVLIVDDIKRFLKKLTGQVDEESALTNP